MVQLVEIACYKCKVVFGMPRDLYEVALQRREGMQFFCPNGHGQHFISGETEADKLRRERDLLKQRLAQKDDEIQHQRDRREEAERRVSAAKGQVTKLKKRASAGVCPCCNRTFHNMAAHMKTKHPEFNPNVVDFEAAKQAQK